MALIAALFLLLAQTPPPAAPTAVFTREALRICVDTAADPARLRALARAEKWTAIDPASVKSHSRVWNADGEVPRAGAWRVQKDGLAFTVAIYDTPGSLLFTSRCELGAWDLDLAAAQAAFSADPRLKEQSSPGPPIRQYEMEKPHLSILYEAGELDGRILHTFAADRR